MKGLLQAVTGWKGYAAAVACGALAVWYVMGLRLNVRDARLETAQERISILEGVNDQAARDVAACNTAVAQIRQDAQDRATRAAEVQAQAEQEIGALAAEVEYWKDRPPAGADICAAISDLRHEYMRGRGRR